MAPDLYLNLVDIRDNVGLYAILMPEILRQELQKRGFDRAESIALVMEEAHDLLITTKTKPRLNELKSLATLIAKFTGLEPHWTLDVLSDLNDCLFKDHGCGCMGL